MKKLGFIFDSSIFEEKEFMDAHDFPFLPFKTDINGKIYEDGVDHSFAEVINLLKDAENPKSSLPSLELITRVMRETSTRYDDVIYLSMTKSFSSTYEYASRIASEMFKNVLVVDTSWFGDQHLEVAKYLKKVYEKTDGNMEVIKKKIAEIDEKSLIFASIKNVPQLLKGGRVAAVKKMVLKLINFLKFKPFFELRKSKPWLGGMARKYEGTIKKMAKNCLKHLNIKDPELQKDEYKLHILHGTDLEFVEEAKEILKSMSIEIASIKMLSPAIAVHTSPSVIAMSIMPNLEKWPIE